MNCILSIMQENLIPIISLGATKLIIIDRSLIKLNHAQTIFDLKSITVNTLTINQIFNFF